MEIKKAQRNSAMELLRIIAMLFIVCSHCSIHGDFPSAPSELLFNNILLDWCILGNLGVVIFMLISGYFLCSNPNFSRVRNGVRLLVQVWFYSVLGLVIYLITGHKFSLGILIKAVFPTIFSEYWFFTTYFVLLIFLPCINILLNKLDRTQHLKLISAMLLLWSVIPTFTRQEMAGATLGQFIMFYSIGAYFRKYPDNILKSKKLSYLLTIVSAVLMFASSIALRLVGIAYTTYFYSLDSVLIIGFATGIFSIAVYKKSFCSKWINTVAGCTFGVYLFHDNPLMRNIIWYEWLPKIKFYNSYLLIAAILLSIAIVMAAGTLIELIRKATVKKPMESLLTKAALKAQGAVNKIFLKVG